MKRTSTRFLVTGALVAALYALLTYVSAALNLAYGTVQFRLSEALTVLPVAAGEAAVVALLGMPLLLFLQKRGLDPHLYAGK